VVGHDRRDRDGDLAVAGPEEQVVEAVAHPADHDEHPVRLGPVVHVPLRAEALPDRGERGAQVGDPGRPRGRPPLRAVPVAPQLHPQVELAAGGVGELLAVGDRQPLLERHAGDGVHDPGAVGAGQGEDDVASGLGGHGQRV
jgi:hypothetical protein